MSQKLSDIMTQSVATVSPEQTVQEAAQLMSQHNVGSIPVVQNGNVVGIVTDRDIALRAVSQGQAPSSTTVQTVMSSSLVTGTPQMDVHEAANLMSEQQIRRLPVVENGQLTGIVALGDLATQNIYQNEAGEALSQISTPATPTDMS